MTSYELAYVGFLAFAHVPVVAADGEEVVEMAMHCLQKEYEREKAVLAAFVGLHRPVPCSQACLVAVMTTEIDYTKNTS
jgi:hypothetical protein